MDNIIQNHEEEFIKDLETGRFVVAIANKGQGKSYLLCSYLRHVLKMGTYENVHFVCPCYKGEASNSYDFLKNQKHVLIYNSYSETVSKRVDADRKKGSTLFLIDDGTAQLINNLDNTFVNLITTNRHFKKCTIYICVHSSKRAMTPIIRNNIDHLLLGKIANVKLLEDIYYEFFSMMFDSFRDFKHFYTENTKENNSSMHFSLHTSGIDPFVKDWKINVNRDNIQLEATKNTRITNKDNDKTARKTAPPININFFKRYK